MTQAMTQNMIRTSETHPLRINVVRPMGLPGEIGMTFCPGKVQRRARTWVWQRDLIADLEAIQSWGGTTLINLIEPYEMEELQVTSLADEARRRFNYVHLPIADGGVPDFEIEQAWWRIRNDIHARLSAGERILIHCKGGLGRTGLMAARILVETGESPESAIHRVRAARPGAIETTVQEICVREQTPLPRYMDLPAWPANPEPDAHVRSRFLGCLIGGAIGDALGAPVEFKSRQAIEHRFGPGGIRDYVPAYGRLGAITDDTQMTLFTAEGLLMAWEERGQDDHGNYVTAVAEAYWRWLVSQGRLPLHKRGGTNVGRLVREDALHERRAPGNTCVTSLLQMRVPGMPARNDSKGCGGVMRVAPVGLFWRRFSRRPSHVVEAFNVACNVAGITHGHPTGKLASGVFAVLVLGLVEGATLDQALDVAMACLRHYPDHGETLAALDKARSLAESGTPHQDAIRQLGEGWIAEEALAIAVYCALVARSFEEGVVLAVNHGGDSDSTGSMAGNLLGALYGQEAMPSRWVEPLELRALIEDMAIRLLDRSSDGSTR